MQLRLIFLAMSTLVLACAFHLSNAAEPPPLPDREAALKKFNDGNFKEAYQDLRRITLDPKVDPYSVGGLLETAIQALNNLGLSDEIDEYREAVIEAQSKNWRLLQAAANSYLYGDHHGVVIAGKFYRGGRREGGEFAQTQERDRGRALQLFEQARKLILQETDDSRSDKEAVGQLYLQYASALYSLHGQGWKLFDLTDLNVLPDIEVGYGSRFDHSQTFAPVDPDGNPLFHAVPKSFETSTTDGERWRYLLSQAAEVNPRLSPQVRRTFADFLDSQFGVQTLAEWQSYFRRTSTEEDGKKSDTGIFELHTLADDETICRLASGIKRFKLADDFNALKIYQELSQLEERGYAESATERVARMFADRRQYVRAAETWKECIRRFGVGKNLHRQMELDQIVKNWCRFETAPVQPARSSAEIDLVFRNGRKIDFQAFAIKSELLLSDVQKYLASNPGNRLNWGKIQIEQIGHRIVAEGEKKYLGEKVAEWSLDLQPLDNHFDRRITVKTPLQKAGAYLLVGTMPEGNTTRILVWVADTVIAHKSLDGKRWYFVADAVTGEPIPNASLEFFGWRQEQVGNQNKYVTKTQHFNETTDKLGQSIPDPKLLDREYQWIVVARQKNQERLAFTGFESIWFSEFNDYRYAENKVFCITDRPVYRPDQKVQFKFWVRRATYDDKQSAEFTNQKFRLQLINPKGETADKGEYTTDEFGGFEGELPIGDDAPLGQYQLQISGPNIVGGNTFRVEEYKKPEYEVTVDAPVDPIQLGEKVVATINAKYYFGGPVAQAKVTYKIERKNYDSRWFPVSRWDWLYGRGYWWFAGEYDWYPGFSRWGCLRPIFSWWPRDFSPPELIARGEGTLDAEGKLLLPIDTMSAKLIHPDRDHEYTITAEVVDQSRRTIVGSGKILVARQPFKVHVWLDRGYYRVGETIQATCHAQTLDGKPVSGESEQILYKIRYDAEGKPLETAVQTFNSKVDADGNVSLKLDASEPGQYRLACKVTDNQQRSIEGAYLFVIRGEGFDGKEFRFNELELITDKKEYKPGDKVRLMINTDRTGGTVALFIRPQNGVYPLPKIIHLDGKSTVEEFELSGDDQPNIFVEAVSISDAQVHEEVREIAIPPEQRVMNIEILPSAKEYLPGQKGEIQLKLTDLEGKPFHGSTVLSMYDRSVEYISGGSNVPEIKEFFWNWKKQHHPQTSHTLSPVSYLLMKNSELGMQSLGIFGNSLADEDEGFGGGGFGYGGGGFGRDTGVRFNRMLSKSMAPAAAPAPMFAPTDAVESESAPLFNMDPPVESATPTAVRTNFADTALWNGKIVANSDGIATIPVTMPENLTGWKIRVWSLGHGTQVGEATEEVVTRKHIMVRLQAPRFFTETDEVVLSAIVHNEFAEAQEIDVKLDLEGGSLENTSQQTQRVRVEPASQQRVDWRVKVIQPGTAVVRMSAFNKLESDAMQMEFPVYIHGILKTDSFVGTIRPEETSGAVKFTIPEKRRVEDSRLEVRYSPTLAGAMVDALPYLIEYPYGCTEQTLNRFVPAVITQKVLINSGIDLKKIQAKKTNLNAQEIGNDLERAAQWKRFKSNPVFDEAELRKIVDTGVQRLMEMQLSNGGWGWFSGFGEYASPHTTAVVVHGLQVARVNDVAVPPEAIQRGIEWLKSYQSEQIVHLQNADAKKENVPRKSAADNLDALVYMILLDEDVSSTEMRDYLYRDRTKLSVYGMSVFGLALHKQGDQEKLQMILQNIDQYLVQDESNETAYLKLPVGYSWWYWHGDEIESNAYYLKLLSRVSPQDRRAARLVKYLLNNRKHATYWNSTRDSALCIEALADYWKASGEDKPDLTVEVWVDGAKKKELRITSENLFDFDNAFVMTAGDLTPGEHTVELRKSGAGPLYFNAYVTNFTQEDFITRAGLEIQVNRKFYKLVP
ncbi:MAG: alpha-2-macroglobulin, partial [Planctomycetaceae bacterium]|nr:alpha-2-macroglobulin [Planctomycetaceae bacterium]